jgi:hypothetical protein
MFILYGLNTHGTNAILTAGQQQSHAIIFVNSPAL